MPRVHGDGFIHIEDVDYMILYDEPIIEYVSEADSQIAQEIGKYVSRLVRMERRFRWDMGHSQCHSLQSPHQESSGVHSELLTDGIVELMQKRVVDNSQKPSIVERRGGFCMGKKETYEYIQDNPAVELRTIDYTNNPLVIANILT